MGSDETTVVLVSGGGPVDAGEVLARRAPASVVVAADSGIDTALALGLAVDVAVGDFDSVTAEGLAAAERGGARLVAHPVDKDATDLALALDEAAALVTPPGGVLVLGGDGGRLDHLVAGLLALADQRHAAVPVSAVLGGSRVHVVHPGRTVELDGARIGEIVSLVPVGGAARGVRTIGLRWVLHDEDLPAGSTRGVSNVVATLPVSVSLREGALLAIRPGEAR